MPQVSSSLYAKPSPPPPPPAVPPLMDQPTPPWKPRSPCVDDTDCALNGACTAAGACHCGSGWTGPSCESLDVLPAPTIGAYGYAPNRSSWGSHVFKYKGKYHGFFAEWCE